MLAAALYQSASEAQDSNDDHAQIVAALAGNAGAGGCFLARAAAGTAGEKECIASSDRFTCIQPFWCTSSMYRPDCAKLPHRSFHSRPSGSSTSGMKFDPPLTLPGSAKRRSSDADRLVTEASRALRRTYTVVLTRWPIERHAGPKLFAAIAVFG